MNEDVRYYANPSRGIEPQVGDLVVYLLSRGGKVYTVDSVGKQGDAIFVRITPEHIRSGFGIMARNCFFISRPLVTVTRRLTVKLN